MKLIAEQDSGGPTAAEINALFATAATLADERGEELYAVGGYVRDRELGLPFSGEIDLSVVGDGPSFARALARRLGARGEVSIYRRFGTAAFSLHDGLRLEFATARRESYRHDSRNPVVEAASFAEDLARRDFTINTLALDVHDPATVLDNFGGLDDLAGGIIRTPRDPSATFNDDPLRILRAVRFAVRLDFTIEPTTWSGLAAHAERLAIVARERINDEFFKTLAHDPPSRGLRLLHEAGVLEVIFPEIAALAGVDQVGKHHHKDVLDHTLQVMDKLATHTADPALRFAALVHDIGKPKTKRFEQGVGWTFHGHEHVGERMVRQMGKRYKLPDETVDLAASLTRLHMRPKNLQEEGVTDSAVRRLIVQAGDRLEELLVLCRADVTSANERKLRRYEREFAQLLTRIEEVEQRDALRAFQSPIRGEEIMERAGLGEGPEVGLIKSLIEEAMLEGEIPFSREGAEEIFDRVATEVKAMERQAVLQRLRQLMQARAEGLPPAPQGEGPVD